MTFEFLDALKALPSGAIVGVIGDTGSGVEELLGAPGPNVRVLTAGEVAALDALQRLQLSSDLRREGRTVLIATHEQDLLRRLCDEVWWVAGGKVQAKGDPSEALAGYARHVSERLRSETKGCAALSPSLRRGDGRAEVVSLQTLGSKGEPTMVWNSGELVSVRIAVKFHNAVEDPVVGMMIRTRIGFEVYGTNTELEQLKLGPCSAGEERVVTFSFRCDLCPQEYTLTAASHDPDGVWHDWLEDALAFSVADTRYTAGVANLQATAKVDPS
ncbi:MAG TPA: Wzt carbohydrate-binding domain-containing protein [Bryobacteraceae bacterium]|nr:Wzt carbohydrate-binding domain-containing protein [Bryobacteraceae bacterium]